MIHITKAKVASKAASPAAISLTLTPAAQPPVRRRGHDSDSDADGPVAQQMLSFVMDDPDFESEASDPPKITKVGVLWSVCCTLA